MTERDHGTPGVCPGATGKGASVSIYVEHHHPLLQRKRARPWAALFAVMTRRWAAAGTHTAGRPGFPWDVAWYGPLVVVMGVKQLHAREREASLAEHVVARVFMGRQGKPRPQMREHANSARASAALGKEGVDEITALLLHGAKDGGCADGRSLSSAPTAQAVPLGYPNAPGILRGLAQRCGRAVAKRKTRAVVGVETARGPVQTMLRPVKAPPLCATGTQAQRQVLTRWLTEVGAFVVPPRLLGQGLGARRDRVTQHASTTRTPMHAVAKRLIPQSVPWRTTGVGATGTILQAGLTQARALGRPKAGKDVEGGVPSLLSRLGGGYGFGTVIRGVVDESQRPWQALAGSRAILGPHAPPALLVYDRGGSARAPGSALANEGGKAIGLQPTGQAAWHVAEGGRETVRSERGKTEGRIGTLKTDK